MAFAIAIRISSSSRPSKGSRDRIVRPNTLSQSHQKRGREEGRMRGKVRQKKGMRGKERERKGGVEDGRDSEGKKKDEDRRDS